jgi:prevent-host-death family protein
MLVKRISVAQARANFSDLLGGVYYSKEAVMVERKGKPVAVVIPPEEFERLQKQQEQAFKTLDRLAERNADKSPDEVLADVTDEVEAVRQEMYERQNKTNKSRR